jgi:recombination protein RecA
MQKMPSSSGSTTEVKMDKDAAKRIKESISEAEGIFGKGSAMQLGNKSPQKADCYSTGSLMLDVVLGCGGLPRGAMTEVFGPEGSGKSTLVLQAIADANRQGGQALYIDSENKLNLQYASQLGVDTKSLIVSQPDYGEAAFQIAEIFIKNKAVSIIVVDSVAMLIPKAEFEGEIGDAGVGQLSRMVTQALRKLKDAIRKSNVAMIFINQVRDKIGVTYGSTETTPAGHALKHGVSVRMDIRRISQIKNGDKVVGARTKAKVVKNTFASPFQECEYDLFYGEGVSREAEVVEHGASRGVIEKAGTTYSYMGERLGVGREASRIFLKQHPEVFDKVYKQVRMMMFAEIEKVQA